MKRYIIPLTIVLAGCQNNTGTITTEVDSQGRPLRTTQSINSKDYARVQMAQASEQSNVAYYQAQAVKYSQVSPEDVALLAAIEALGEDRSPTNSNDVLISQEKSSVEKHKTWAGFGKSVITGTIAGVGIVKTADVLKTAMSQGGVTVNGDNNEIRGTNTGENGTASYSNNEPVTNNTTNEASSSESSESSSSSSTCESLGGVWVADEERCSDGSGGTIDIDSGETTTEENTAEENTAEETTTEETTSEETTG